jgi:hypothetical protein
MDTTADDIDFITDDINAIKKSKVAHTRVTATKKIKVRSGLEVARDSYKATRKLHRQAIKSLKRAIKAHKLQVKQARNSYKLIKLNK